MSRHPLTALPLSHFITSSSARAVTLPSPISLPAKRSATATPEAEGSGRRKAVRTITPKARAVLERDELGVGKSPARRLFVDADADGSARVGSGISGAVATPPSAPSRALAPSPPIIESPSGSSSITIPAAQSTSSSRSSTRESYFPLQPVVHRSPRPTEPASLDNGAELSIHDPGFEIFADMEADVGASSSTSVAVGVGVGIGTPNSRRIAITGVSDSTTVVLESQSFVPSPTPSSNRYEDQENIPPSLRSTPSNTSLRSTSTPNSKSIPNSHHSACSASTSTSSTGSSTWYDDDETFVLGSGRRFHGRSKLAQVIAGEVPDGEHEDRQGGEGGEDLTPGKMTERHKDKGKAKMAEEVDAA